MGVAAVLIELDMLQCRCATTILVGESYLVQQRLTNQDSDIIRPNVIPYVSSA